MNTRGPSCSPRGALTSGSTAGLLLVSRKREMRRRRAPTNRAACDQIAPPVRLVVGAHSSREDRSRMAEGGASGASPLAPPRPAPWGAAAEGRSAIPAASQRNAQAVDFVLSDCHSCPPMWTARKVKSRKNSLALSVISRLSYRGGLRSSTDSGGQAANLPEEQTAERKSLKNSGRSVSLASHG